MGMIRSSCTVNCARWLRISFVILKLRDVRCLPLALDRCRKWRETQMSEKIISTNRAAYHDFHILETYEAGLELTGTEVKSARAGRVNLKDAYAMIREGQA